jgi:tetratricopeptide (TPR) repeat protein
MKVMARILALIALLALVATAPVTAQSTQQPPPKPPATPAQPPAKQPGTPAAAPGAAPAEQPPAPPVNPEEEAAYKAFLDSKDQTMAAKLGEEFAQKFPQSRYIDFTYTKLSQLYANLQQLDKLAVVGDKALALNPDNLDVLTILCWTIARSTRPDALDAKQKWEKADKFGRRAVELLTALQKPEQLTEEQFQKTRDEALSRAHSGLGVVQFRRELFAEAATEFEQSVKLSADPDPTDLFLFGFVLKATKRHAEAADAFGRCGLLPGPFQDACKKEQAENKKLAENTLAPPKP